MARSNPLIPIIASCAGFFIVLFAAIFLNLDLLNSSIKLKAFDTLMGVGVGVNLALGVLKGIRESICQYYILRFNGVKADLSDRLSSLLKSNKTTEEAGKEIELKSNNLQLSIDNTKAHDRVKSLTVWLSICAAVMYCFGLTLSAFRPDFLCSAWLGLPLALFILAPLGVYVLCISLLAAYPEYKLVKDIKNLKGYSEMFSDSNKEIKPASPTHN